MLWVSAYVLFPLKTTGGTAISNEAGLVFELRDAKKKVEGKARISIQDFFKGKRNFETVRVHLKEDF